MGGSRPAFVAARTGGEYGFVTAFVREGQRAWAISPVSLWLLRVADGNVKGVTLLLRG